MSDEKYYYLECPLFFDASNPRSIHDCLSTGEGLYDHTVWGDYKKLNKEELFGFIDKLFSKLDEDGLWHRLVTKEGESMDDISTCQSLGNGISFMFTDDYELDTVYRPSQCLLACCVYAATRYPKSFFEKGRGEKLLPLFQSWYYHGNDEEENTLMVMLGRANIKGFFRKFPEFDSEAVQRMKEHFEYVKKFYRELPRSEKLYDCEDLKEVVYAYDHRKL